MRSLMLSAALFLLGNAAAFSFSFEPITRDFSPSGPGTVQTFRLENEGEENVAVRIKIFAREMDENGRETQGPEEGLFLVYPSRAVLRPRSAQSVKVQWLGPATIDTEKCFRILVEQMPVNFTEQAAGGSHIRIMFRYLGALYVVPPRASHDVILESFKPGEDPKGNKGLELVFLNKGNAHVILGDLEMTLKREDSLGGHFSVPPEALKGLSGENLLPGHRRRFFLTAPGEYSREDTSITYKFDPIR